MKRYKELVLQQLFSLHSTPTSIFEYIIPCHTHTHTLMFSYPLFHIHEIILKIGNNKNNKFWRKHLSRRTLRMLTSFPQNASIQFPFCSLAKRVEMYTLALWPQHHAKISHWNPHANCIGNEATQKTSPTASYFYHCNAKLCTIIHSLQCTALNLRVAFFLVSFVFTVFFYFVKIQQFAALPEFLCLQTHSTFSVYFETKFLSCNHIVGEMLWILTVTTVNAQMLVFIPKSMRKQLSFWAT